MNSRYLILEDGKIFKGEKLGSNNFKIGEIIFNTSMTSYEEILTDTTYYGNILVMTYPLIGNYGISKESFESIPDPMSSLVVSEACDEPSSYMSEMKLDDFLKIRNISAIKNIDTRSLTRYLREKGSMKATLSDSIDNLDDILKELKEYKQKDDLVKDVSITKAFHIPNIGRRIVLIDYGSNNQSLRELIKRGVDVNVLPYNTSIEKIDSIYPDGILLSNGPGNPESLKEEIKNIKGMIGKYPILAIGLGHQLLSQAYGAKTKKMKVGLHGTYPVRNLKTGKIQIESLNNSYYVSKDSLNNPKIEISHEGIDNNQCLGFISRDDRVISVQFNPELSTYENGHSEVYDKFFELLDEKE